MMKARIGIGGGLALAALVALAPSPAFAEPSEQALPVNASACAAAAETLVESNDAHAVDGYDYACAGGSVSVVVAPGTADSARLTTTDEDALDGKAVQPLAVNCDPTGGPIRTIASELQDNIEFCVVYGQVDHPTNGTWSRSILVDWIMYPGWSSAQNVIHTIPSEGSPTLEGTVSSRKQNGILPPTALATSLWSNTGNQTTSGWNVGGLTTGGSHSVAINDLEVTDPSYGFNYYIGDDIATHRFTCDTEQQRCYYPNGEEAGL